jgi:CMP-N-acetylneuraminic acid synthetase
MNALGVIPARGGSKGIPRKNLIPLLGRPLLAYTLDAARTSSRLARAIVSSDDSEIIDVARELGADVPFVRPVELADDAASSAAVARHALLTIEALEGKTFDAVVLLEPTAPLRVAEDIDAALDMLQTSDVDSVVSVCRVEAPHPFKMQRVVNGRLKPWQEDQWREGRTRQELPPVYFLNGAVYATRANVLREAGSLWGAETGALIMPLERSVNIDSILDVALAEVFLKARMSG